MKAGDHAYRATRSGPRKQRKPAGQHTIAKTRVGGKRMQNKLGKAAKKGA